MKENRNLILISDIKDDYTNIEIKTYLPFAVKKTLIKNILEASSITENNVIRIDYSVLEMVTQYILVNNYTNISFESEDVMVAYDKLKQMGVVDYIMKELYKNNEINFFNVVLKQEINQIYTVDNSLSSVISKTLIQLGAKIPDAKEINKMIPKLSKELNKISPETMELLKSISKQQI